MKPGLLRSTVLRVVFGCGIFSVLDTSKPVETPELFKILPDLKLAIEGSRGSAKKTFGSLLAGSTDLVPRTRKFGKTFSYVVFTRVLTLFGWDLHFGLFCSDGEKFRARFNKK